MEALAAVGLAGNIIQFVDFSCKLFERTTSIYHSHTGSSVEADSIESITKDLQDLSAKLSHSGQHHAASLQYDASLRKLAQDCQEAAAELLAVLQHVRAKKRGSKWSSFRAALSSSWKQPQVDALEKRLMAYRSQIILHLQFMQDNKSSEFFNLMDELNHKSEEMGADMANQIANLRKGVLDAIESLRPALADHRREDTPELEMPSLATIASTLIRSEQHGISMVASLTVLESLTFDQMDYRHAKVPEAHPTTCEHVYTDKIVPWLQSSSPIFWISGKPGSGKSTLMKYIVDNPAISNLKSLTDGRVPKVASYFFWINGTEMQRSQQGLLRSLLYEVLCQSPDLVLTAFPDMWRKMGPDNQLNPPRRSWNKTELLHAFERLAEASPRTTRLCLFIDGLDEYDGDPDDLISTVRCLEAMQIKLCIASRPWNVFEEAFGLDEKRKIYLQDLNKPGIERYVFDELRNRPEFRNMEISSDEADRIVSEIVERSQGVFLWVFLVVRSLKNGLRNRDRLAQLQKRLSDFPDGLEEFFGHMFRSVDPIYHTQTAHTFLVALNTATQASPLMYWFLDELEDDPNLALNMPIKSLKQREMERRMETSRIRINARCMGLLEVTRRLGKEDNFAVDFLHRTVKDFLLTNSIYRVFDGWRFPEFDPHMSICKASVAELKARSGTEYPDLSPASYPPKKVSSKGIGAPALSLRVILQNFFSSAKKIELKCQSTPELYLQEVERIGTIGWEKEEQPWDVLEASNSLGHPKFFHHVIAYDLQLYALTIKEQLKDLCFISENEDDYTPIFEIDDLTLEMTRLILSSASQSMGRPCIFATTAMDIKIFLEEKSNEDVHAWMQCICQYATFTRSQMLEGSATQWFGKVQNFENFLGARFTNPQLQELRQMNRQRQEEIDKYLQTAGSDMGKIIATTSSVTQCAVNKREKRMSFFRRLFH